MLNALKNHLTQLTPSERKVADFILQNPTEVSYLTVQQLADQVATSTATIMRLSAKLGYTGFAEFQTALQAFLKADNTPKARLMGGLKTVGDNELFTKILAHHSGQIASLASLDPTSLSCAVEYLATAQKIITTSVRSGLSIGVFLNQNINRIRGNSQFIQADLSDWADDVVSLGKPDVLIVISFARYARRIGEFARIAKHKGAKVIAITDSYTAPIVDSSDIVLVCNTDSLSFHHSPVGAMILAEYLITALAKQQPNASDRLDEVATVLKEMGYHS